MIIGQEDALKSKMIGIKNIPKLFKILLAICLGVVFLMLSFKIGDFIYCHTVVICDPIRPTMSPEMIATEVAIQYEMAIQDIDKGHYDMAKERLEYIFYHDPEYPNVEEKLLEVEDLLKLTPTP